mgnify:CR=1 FL=1
MKIKLILLASLFAVGFAMSATAGSVTDTDGDGVPDVFDNCSEDPNGPNEAPRNQVDTDLDGFGNWCDADYDNNGVVDGGDFGEFVANFNTGNAETDHDSNGVTDGGDFGRFVALFNMGPGPSGLSCAGTVPCTP